MTATMAGKASSTKDTGVDDRVEASPPVAGDSPSGPTDQHADRRPSRTDDRARPARRR